MAECYGSDLFWHGADPNRHACHLKAYWKIQPDPMADGTPRAPWYACRVHLEQVCLVIDADHPGVESTLSRADDEHHLARGFPETMKAALGDQFVPYTCSCGRPWPHEGVTA